MPTSTTGSWWEWGRICDTGRWARWEQCSLDKSLAVSSCFLRFCTLWKNAWVGPERVSLVQQHIMPVLPSASCGENPASLLSTQRHGWPGHSRRPQLARARQRPIPRLMSSAVDWHEVVAHISQQTYIQMVIGWVLEEIKDMRKPSQWDGSKRNRWSLNKMSLTHGNL